MTSFNQLVAENNNDPQWLQMVQSLINYKQKLVEHEEKTQIVAHKLDKSNIRKILLDGYKVHTVNGKQYLRLKHLTEVLNQSKILKRDIERNGFVALNTLLDWIHDENEKVKKVWIKQHAK